MIHGCSYIRCSRHEFRPDGAVCKTLKTPAIKNQQHFILPSSAKPFCTGFIHLIKYLETLHSFKQIKLLKRT